MWGIYAAVIYMVIGSMWVSVKAMSSNAKLAYFVVCLVQLAKCSESPPCPSPIFNLLTPSSCFVASNCSGGQAPQGREQRNPKSMLSGEGQNTSLPTLSKPPPPPTNLSAANLLWNLKNLICQHVSIICSITVRASGRGQRPRTGGRWWEGVEEEGCVTCCRAKAAALRWEDGTVIRPSRWLELSWTA